MDENELEKESKIFYHALLETIQEQKIPKSVVVTAFVNLLGMIFVSESDENLQEFIDGMKEVRGYYLKEDRGETSSE